MQYFWSMQYFGGRRQDLREGDRLMVTIWWCGRLDGGLALLVSGLLYVGLHKSGEGVVDGVVSQIGYY